MNIPLRSAVLLKNVNIQTQITSIIEWIITQEKFISFDGSEIVLENYWDVKPELFHEIFDAVQVAFRYQEWTFRYEDCSNKVRIFIK